MGIGKAGGIEGKDLEEFTMSQMLIAEGEDLYNLMQKYQPTKFVKEKSEDNKKFWAEVAPAEFKKLEDILAKAPGDAFTTSKTTVGELYLFAMLHQMVLVAPECLAATPGMQKFYDTTKALPGVVKVLKGDSAFGAMEQYF